LLPDFLFGLKQFTEVLRSPVVVAISVKTLPGCEELRVFGTRHSGRVARLEGFAWKRVVVVVLIAGSYELGRMGVIVDRLDLIDGREELRIGSLREHCLTGYQAKNDE